MRNWCYRLVIVFLLSPQLVHAANIQREIDTAWIIIAGALVFFMQAGFALVEAGFTRAKNTVNIMGKNLLDFVMSVTSFYLFGYAIMFGTGNLFWGDHGFLMIHASSPINNVPIWAFWFFQAVFAGTAATIVSGTVAERIRFDVYLFYSFLITVFVYPVVGHWIWGDGWLQKLGFVDFAGSTVVHSVGGWAGLVGTSMLGPRIGKYYSNGKPKLIKPHSIPLAALGTFILWFGWYGFNPGSSLSLSDPKLVARIVLNTTLAAVSGGFSSLIFVWIKFRKPDISMVLNGVLSGLVAVTAGCAFIEPGFAFFIGIIAGILVVLSVTFWDKIHIDDPVGAISVHAVNGTWGTLAVGLFGKSSLGVPHGSLFYGNGLKQLGIQLLGSASAFVYTIVAMYLIFLLAKAIFGSIRVSREEELIGLDLVEHGIEAYGGFQIFITE